MKYTGYGIFLGFVLTLGILSGYIFFHNVSYTITLPYIFLGMVIYFYLVGFHTGDKTQSFKEGLKAGLISGLIAMVWTGVAFALVHNVFFYNETVTEPEKLAAFKRSGLLSMQRFLIYQDIRYGVIGLIAGPIFGAMCSGAGSFTASKLHRKHTTVYNEA